LGYKVPKRADIKREHFLYLFKAGKYQQACKVKVPEELTISVVPEMFHKD
jgi:hypothetical protein